MHGERALSKRASVHAYY